jgi:alpha-L-arabinofuranosidase
MAVLTPPGGQSRIADGHPEPYDVEYFELGNEQYVVLRALQVAGDAR